jgi:hypothetical protein
MKNYFKILLALSFIFFLASCSVVSKEQNQTNAGINIDFNDIDLKDIPIMGGKVQAVFVFSNTGKESVVLLNGTTSCMCTEAVIESADGTISPKITMVSYGGEGNINKVLNPGEEVKLIATFDPLAHGPDAIGPIQRQVMIRTNSIQTPELIFRFKGHVDK